MASYPTASYSSLAPQTHVYNLDDLSRNHYNVPQAHTPYDKKQPTQATELPAEVSPILPQTQPPTRSVRGAWQADYVDKVLLVLATVVPLVASVALFVATVLLRVRSTGPLLAFTTDNRATTSIIVSIISSILAMLNMYTVTRSLSLATRLHLLNSDLSLGALKLINAVSTRQLATEVPLSSWAISLVMATALMVPNFVFTGALTPVVTTAETTSINPLKIPQYTSDSKWAWGEGGKIQHGDCATVTNDNGTFSLCSAETIQSSLMSRGSQGVSDPNQIHLKNDNSLYNYRGRSYGVGASAGLVDHAVNDGDNKFELLSYSYTEPGYTTNIHCFKNEDSEYSLKLISSDGTTQGIPDIYSAEGYFPDGDQLDHFAVVGMGGDDMIAVMAAKTYANRHMILITAGSDYEMLDKTQCNLEFNPSLFDVVVDVNDKFIKVTPSTAPPPDPKVTEHQSFDYTGGLVNTTMGQLNAIGMTSTTIYTSTFGDSLLTNINRTATKNPDRNTTYEAISGSLEAMVDDLLLFIGTSQFFLPSNGTGDFTTVQARMTVRAVRVGDSTYVIAAFVMCLVLFLVLAIEMVRTKVWKFLPKWDFTDPADLLLASSVAGEDVVEEVCRQEGGRPLQKVSSGGMASGVDRKQVLDNVFSERWAEGARDQALAVRLRLGKRIIGVVPAEEQQEEGDYVRIRGTREVRLAAVSLRTSHAKDIASLW